MVRASIMRPLGSLVGLAAVGLTCSSLNKTRKPRAFGLNLSFCEPEAPRVPIAQPHQISSVKQITMPDGSQYMGTLQDGKRWGKGKSLDKKGYYYGLWVDNVKCGHGILKYRNGYVYEGNFAKDMPNGHGKITLRNGKVYEGEFVDGVLQGQPRFTANSVGRYEGDVLADLPHGRGVIVYYDGAREEGEFCEGMLIQGKYTTAKGMIDEGEFVRGLLVIGKRTWPDGRTHTGTFRNNQLHGQGCISHRSDGSVTVGDYVDGVNHGRLKATFPDGMTMTGTVVNGVGHGMIRKVLLDGTTIEQECVRGVEQKATKITQPDGTVMEGNLESNQAGDPVFQGRVRITLPDKTVQEGEYVEGLAHGHFTAKRPSGVIEEGLYKCGEMYGEWKITYPDGRTEVKDYTPNLVDRARLLEMEQRLIYLPKLKEKVKSVLPTKKDDK